MDRKSKKQCARCGSCTVVCPVFRVTGREELAARGKLHLLTTSLAEDPSDHFQDIFAQCLLCGACEDNCSRQLPIMAEIIAARSTFSHLYGRKALKRTLVRLALSRPALLEGLVQAGLSLSGLSLLPEKSGLRIKLGLLDHAAKMSKQNRAKERTEKKTCDAAYTYFSGCMARYLQPSIGDETMGLTESMTGMPILEPEGQVCCGLAAWSSGKEEEARDLARKNIETFAGSESQILTSCASCSSHLKNYSAMFEDDPQWREKAKKFSIRIREFTSFVDDHVHMGDYESDLPVRVFYHEPCHLRFDKDNSNAAKQIFAKVENVSLVCPDTGSLCCGQGGLFHLGYPELSRDIFSRVFDQVVLHDVDVVVTSCSGCLMQWQAELAMRGSNIRAIHLAQWLRLDMQKNG